MVNENLENNSKFLEPFMNLISKLFSQEDQKYLENAANAFKDGNYHSAVTEYRKCVNLIGRINPNNNEPSQVDVVIRYILSKCLLQSSHFEDFLEARNILMDLEKSVGRTYPMIYHDLAELYIKLFCFDEAERSITKGFSVLGKKKTLLMCFLPGSNDVIPESTKQDLVEKLFDLREQCSGWHPPDAKCFMDNCGTVSPNHLCGRSIFMKSPAYSGMVTLTCSNMINPCTITFHSLCWKIKKDEVSLGMKISDKEILLNWECFTPNCSDGNKASLIKKIVIHKEDGTVKSIEPSVEKSNWHAQQNFVPKGAIHKKKMVHKTNTQLSRIKSSTIESMIQVPEKMKHEAEIEIPKNDPVAPRLSKLMDLRYHNFRRNSWTEWRPDRSNYGNRKQRKNVKLRWPVSPEDTKELVQLKSFLFSYFYQYLKKNGPVKEEIFLEKWIETTKVIDNCQSVIKNVSCIETVKEFFLESVHFTMIGKYFVIMPLLPGAYHIVKKETGDNVGYLINHPEANRKKRRKKKTSTVDEGISNDVKGNKLEEQGEIVENGKRILANEQKDDNSETSTHKLSLCNEINEVSQDDDSLNGFSSISETFEDINSRDSPVTIEESEMEKQAGIIENLRRDLNQAHAQLEYTKAQLLTMKMRMLQDSLDYQYIEKNIVITCQKEKTQNELGIIKKIQNILATTIGSCLTLDLREWTDPIGELENIKERLNAEYLSLTTLIKSAENYEVMDDVNLEPTKITSLPHRNVKALIQLAADKLQKFYKSKDVNQNMDSSSLTSRQWNQPQFCRLSAPPGFSPESKKPKVPAYIPPPILRRIINSYKKDLQLGQFVPSDSNKPEIDSKDIKTAEPQNLSTERNFTRATTLSQHVEAAQSSSCNVELSNSSDAHALEESMKNIPESNDFIEIDRDTINNNTPVNASKNRKSSDKSRSPAFYKIMEVLRERHPDVPENDLAVSVRMLRKVHGNSFKGLGLARIVKEIDGAINVKKQNFNSENKRCRNTAPVGTPEMSPHLMAFGRSFNASISSSASGSLISKEFTPRINPWKLIPQQDAGVSETPGIYDTFPSVVQRKEIQRRTNPWDTIKEVSWTKECLENQCVICIEAFNGDTNNPTYTLKCQHTFHKTCIRNWFAHNRSCPTCRVHSTIDDEFPPLP